MQLWLQEGGEMIIIRVHVFTSIPDSFLSSSAEDYAREIFRRHPGQLLINGRLQQLEPYRGQQLFLNRGLLGPKPEDAGGSAPWRNSASTMQPSPMSGFRRVKQGVKRQCCLTKCTAREISYSCRSPWCLALHRADGIFCAHSFKNQSNYYLGRKLLPIQPLSTTPDSHTWWRDLTSAIPQDFLSSLIGKPYAVLWFPQPNSHGGCLLRNFYAGSEKLIVCSPLSSIT